MSRSAVITQIAKMDINGSISYSNDNQPSSGSRIIDAEKNPSEKDASNPLFVNHAEIAWHARRRAWVGDQSRKPIQRLSEPLTIHRDISSSWNTTYKDLELFSASIPLADIVVCLNKDWLDEGLYDW